jgi:hypothetical protein
MDVKVGERHFISFPAARWRGVDREPFQGAGQGEGPSVARDIRHPGIRHYWTMV